MFAFPFFRRLREIWPAAVLALATVHPAAAQSDVLALDDLLNAARNANPTLLAARLEAEALATRPEQVASLPDPRADVSYRPFAINRLDGAVPAGISLSQEVPFPGKLQLAADAARQAARMSALEADELQLEVEFQVRESYYELARIQEQDEQIVRFQAQLSDYEQAASTQYEVGAGPQQAILKAQLERTSLERRRLDLATERRSHLERLARLTNRPELASNAAPMYVVRLPVDASVAGAMTTRPAIAAMEVGIAMSETEIALAKREYLPDFMIGVGFMDMMVPGGAAMPLDDLGDRFGIELGIVIPLQRGRRDAALEEARIRRSQYEARLEAVRSELRTESNDLRNRILENEKALALYEETLLPQAETTLEATLSAYATGQADFLDLLDAQRMIFDLRVDYEDRYANLLRSHARLVRTLGMPASGPFSRLNQ